MITKRRIKDGIRKGLITFVVDPNLESGTVCKIGEAWFYFGGLTAESHTPEEYVNAVPEDDIVDEIFEVLDEFKDLFVDEYCYYDCVLAEGGIY